MANYEQLEMLASKSEKFFLNSVIASSLSNMVGTIAGHPLDTIKVRMQMDSRPITIRNCLMETVKFEGYAGLWKGI
jgi:solute carrier family 25 (mitochondrial carnitine/acylcarnitine transporter), member 20/29